MHAVLDQILQADAANVAFSISINGQDGRRIRDFHSCRAVNRWRPVGLVSPTDYSTVRWSMSCSSGLSRSDWRSTECRLACTVLD